jgi:hypothetical protein
MREVRPKYGAHIGGKAGEQGKGLLVAVIGRFLGEAGQQGLLVLLHISMKRVKVSPL